ncbi:MAG: hypothetical protein UZ18_ATM001000011, partial [Armatimonadetes bacterium OLB18]
MRGLGFRCQVSGVRCQASAAGRVDGVAVFGEAGP